tara:strand:- start:161 stop:424 length:264 start_codon:yes stop_codon:yes gene_type:complete
MKNVSMQGCYWIMDTVNQALPDGYFDMTLTYCEGEKIDLKGAMAYAEDAEYQMSLGNPPCFEVASWRTSSGHVEEFEVPEEYIEEVE